MLLALLLLSARAALTVGVSAPEQTFLDRDPVTGNTVQCDRCPPGTFLRASCSSTQKSQCAPCPQGSFTELWNHIPRCLRCGVCGQNQVVKRPCAPDSDCECECRPGYFYEGAYDMCVRHSQCASGHGVLTRGSAQQDTVCQVCPDGTFSSVSSAELNCSTHRSCVEAGLQEVLRGATWHDSVCADGTQLRDGADYLRDILPAFFAHHHMNVRRLRRIVRRLPREPGVSPADPSELGVSELRAHINAWVAAATPMEIRQLPSILTRIKAQSIGERLERKLEHIDGQLRAQRGNEVL